MYAIFETGGKQYRVQNGDVLFVEKLNAAEEETVTFDKVIAMGDGKKMKVGAPYVKGAVVKAVVEESFKDKKVIVLKYKSKKDYRRTIGHRQQYTNIRVTDIVLA